MITLIIKSYLSIFMAIGISTAVFIVVGLYYIYQYSLIIPKSNLTLVPSDDSVQAASLMVVEPAPKPEVKHESSITSLVELTRPRKKDDKISNVKSIKQNHTFSYSDMTAIAGDDVIATQLDLAKALIETGKREAANGILYVVLNEGNKIQQAQARKLLASKAP